MKTALSKLQRVKALLTGGGDDPLSGLRDLRGAAEIEEVLVGLLARRAGVPRAKVIPTEPLANLGMDSLELVVLVTELEQALDLRLDTAFFWDYPTLRAVAQRVHTLRAAAP